MAHAEALGRLCPAYLMPQDQASQLSPRGDMVATQIEGANPPRLEGEYLTDLSGKTGAGEGIRTLDPNLGKVVLYP
jgi:hypothetical protein